MERKTTRAGTRTRIRHAMLTACSLSFLASIPTAIANDGSRPSFDLRSRLDMRIEAPKGVGNNLAAMFREQQASRTSLAATASARGFRTQGDDVLTDVVLRSHSADLAERIESTGGIVRSISEKYLRASVLVSSEAEAAAIGALPEVRWVSVDYGARRNVGSVTSRAVEALDVTPIAGAPNNLDGAGQTIGILSDSFARTNDVVDGDTTTNGSSISGSGNSSPVTLRNTTPQDSGDLPSTVVLRRDDGTPSSGGSLIDEGAAMAELVHDLAPEANIAFYSAFVSFDEFAAGIDDLCTSSGSGGTGSTVVVDDILYFAELMYQPDIVSQAVSECVANDVPYFSSAGNAGDSGFRQTYSDIDTTDNDDDETDADNDGVPPGSSSGDFHDWNPGGGGDKTLAISIPSGESITAILQWNQPAITAFSSNAPQIDLDLYLFDVDAPFQSGTTVLASSFRQQSHASSTSGLEPFEIIPSYTNTTASSQTVFLGIDHWGGSRTTIPQDAATDLELRLVILESAMAGSTTYEYTPDGPSMYGHAVANGAVSVAAVPWYEAPIFDETNQGSPNIDPEPFSSRGGGHGSPAIPFFFGADGTFASSTAVEPDLAAVDGNNTTFFGSDIGPIDGTEADSFPNFFGTSAAAPNAAAVAALLLQYSDGVTPADLQNVLEMTATDVTGDRAAVGDDDVTGAGLIDADDTDGALAEFPAADAVLATATPIQTGTPGVALDGSGSSDNIMVTGFAWTQLSGTMVTLNNANTDSPTFDAPSASDDLAFKLSVSDADGLTHADTVTVEIDAPPVADAGPPQQVATNATVTLDARGSSDDRDPLTYDWSQTSGTTVALDNDTAEQPTFTAPAAPETLTFEVEVTDGSGFTDTDQVDIVVETLTGSLPIANAGGDITVETGDAVQLDGSGSADDDGPVAHAWDQIGGSTVVLNNANTVNPGFTAPSTAGTLEFRLQVTDGDGFTDTDSVSVTVVAPASGDGGGGSGSGGGGGGGSLDWLLLGLLGAGARWCRRAD